VPRGPHAGNLDLSELSEGSTLYIPVWKPPHRDKIIFSFARGVAAKTKMVV
jgi:hypothetical protein